MATLTSQQAVQHLNDMQTTLGKLEHALTELTAAGNKVKKSWHGRSANEFAATWHSYQSSFTQLKGDMTKLHNEVKTINDNIANSGGGFG
jgi:WXG100 family type VII secretion target